MKRVYLCLCIMACCIGLTGCKQSGRALPSANGSIYELLAVIDNTIWESPLGDSIKSYMGADMPCLPQMEPYFTVSQVSPQLFDDFLKPTRNILYVDINPSRYTQAKVKYHENVYAQPQVVCVLQSPSQEEAAVCFEAEKTAIRQWFVRQELARQGRFYRNYKTTDTREAVQRRLGSDICIPSDYLLVMDSADFVWCVNDGGSLRRDLIIWSYPYTSESQLTKEALLAKRNEVLGAHISGQLEGSHLGTEYNHFPPQFTPITVNNRWCAEIRGLWKMLDGEAMGGPFVQHTRIDEINNRVITAEVFIFAPGQKKRNPLRQAEAILYTLKLPQEINQLKEVEVSNTKE